MSTKITWQEPPTPAYRPHTNIGAISNELKLHPGRWALIGENMTTGSAMHFKKKYGLEVRTVTAGKNYPKGRADVYARWPEAVTP